MTDDLTQILHDPTRLAALRELALLDSPAEEAFDRLTRLASQIVHAPISLVSLVDVDRQFFKSTLGVPEPWASRRETPLSHSFCKHVVASGEPLIVEDARKHPILRDNPAVSDLNVIAYLGMPLATPGGAELGSFCVIDHKPRVWTAQDIEVMRELGTAVMTEIELRHAKQQAEAALRENEARLQRLTENAQDIIYRYCLVPTARLEYINPAITAITGYTVAECYAQPGLFFSLIHEEDEWLLAQLLAPGQDLSQRVVLRWVHKDGTIIWTEQSNVLLNDETGRLVAIEGIARDITGRKRLEAEALQTERLRVELEKEREIIDLKERFLSMVSHEFRTPLTVITMASSLLEKYYTMLTPEKRLQQFQHIQTQAKYMTQLLEEVLTLSKAQTGQIVFAPAPLDVPAFCRNIFEQFQLIDQTGHALLFRCQGDWDKLLMDESLLRHILVNLLSNAIKYSPQGGEVCFEMERQPEAVVFRISDQGIGIPQADLARLFEPFHRAINALKIAGTGLGLPIVKSNVEAHGGTITAESQEGEGTTFTVRLPILPNQSGDPLPGEHVARSVAR